MQNRFVEVRPPSQPKRPDLVHVYVSSVESKNCGPLLKELSKRKDERETSILAHLKRVRRLEVHEPEESNNQILIDDEFPCKKKQKISKIFTLEVLLGMVTDASQETEEWLTSTLLTKYELELQRRWLPGRPAESDSELTEFNRLWPTIYYRKQSQQHKEQALELSDKEWSIMQHGMELAIEDAKRSRKFYQDWKVGHALNRQVHVSTLVGVVVLCPETGRVVSWASDELQRQVESTDLLPNERNPLCTSLVLAIQGVSRKERMTALGQGMDSSEFKNGQYLCTGYDVYLTQEPVVFEAMAMVHSRVRRVTFGVSNELEGGLGGTGMATAVHSLPGTNHHYRVFKCSSQNSALQVCEKLHPPE